ncbi:hypothetical protein L1987_05106 [Smallanthus sonchifolius]|uniref:Uncharacterized protein n=1 Tax=Smallanthus sonchifolius TaxID=185202 RepID=A0ACB9JUE7_9ASTR|nr:hypothetical protein L1987_05106 [Smallanthus sonchifolius]
MAKRRWLSLIKRFLISERCQNRSKEKKRSWVFGRHKLNRLTSQSTLVERPKLAEKKVKPEGFLVGQEIDEPKQVSDGDIGVKEGEYCATIKIQTVFRGFLNLKGGLCSLEVENDKLSDEIWSLMKDYLEGSIQLQSNIEGLSSSLEFIQTEGLGT